MWCPVFAREVSTLMDSKLDLWPRIGSKIHHDSYDGGVQPFYLISTSRLVPNGVPPEVGVAFTLQSVIPVVERIFLIGPSWVIWYPNFPLDLLTSSIPIPRYSVTVLSTLISQLYLSPSSRNDWRTLSNYFWCTCMHRWELPVLHYPRNMVIYHCPLIGEIYMVILHVFIIKNYPNLFSNYYPKYTIRVNYSFILNFGEFIYEVILPEHHPIVREETAMFSYFGIMFLIEIQWFPKRIIIQLSQ